VQRPLMDSMHIDNESDKRSARSGLITRAVKILLSRPFNWKRIEAILDDGSPFWRFCRGLLYRLALLPMLAMLVAAARAKAGSFRAASATTPTATAPAM